MDMGGEMPPIDQPQIGGEMPPQGEGEMGMEEPQSDEGEGKEDLQSMAGKMSNIIQNGADVDKDDVKAALNMIIAQAKKVLDGNDLKASADKLTNVADASVEDDGNGEMMPQEEPQEAPQQMEGREYIRKAVNEILNDLNGNADAEDEKRVNKKMTNKTIRQNNPYLANR